MSDVGPDSSPDEDSRHSDADRRMAELLSDGSGTADLRRALSPRRGCPSTSGIVTRSVAANAGRQGRAAPQLGKRVGLGKQIKHAGHAIGGRPGAGPARRVGRATAPERGDECRPVPERRRAWC